MTSSLDAQLDEVRATFPAWAMFRSDEGAYYATRRGVILSGEQLKMGMHRTVAAEDLPTLVELLHEQAKLN
ncbi:hypothetical protein [Sphaerimonospora thailandensis]|uniref:Uncharacterized protein n=1 Tax=Sphaerimonospora thailandensis TaxID=795644 RepID=A0A8J3R4G7_9ACTN|nr:hypothetical protein [Sphaerimonospora thailandensis]GIH69041.1 hypothetical protein Mth01_12940 [Sphaerimonospora thailandensis]